MATWVVRNRKSLFGSVEQAARQAGMSRITWDRVEAGLKVQDSTYTAVNKVFHLKPGEHEAIMAGREPQYEDFTPEPESESESEPDTVEAIMSDDRLTDDDKARLVDLYERMRSDDNNGRGRRHA